MINLNKYLGIILALFSLIPGVHGQVAQKSFSLVNSPYDEQSPVLSHDGKVLYWTIAHHPGNTGGIKDPGDIWYSVWTGDAWSSPLHGGNLINDAGYNAVSGISNDGNRLFLSSHYASGANPITSQGIAMSMKSPEGWSKPENIHIPYFLNRSPETQGYLSTDLGVFIFSADSYNTVGGEDLYISRLVAGQWTEPENLGSKINSTRQEFSPSLSVDGTILYFASNGRKGYGSADIYYATRLDNTWTNWSDPINMGANVNSEGRERYYRTYPFLGNKFALFTSTHNSDGLGDIKYYQPPKDLQDSLIQRLHPDSSRMSEGVSAQLVAITREKPIAGEEKLFQVNGKVTAVKTNLPLRATLSFHADSLYTVVAGPDGRYSITFPSVNEYAISVEASGYVGTFEKLDVRTYEMKSLEMNFKLQPIEIGATVNLKSVLFQQSTPNLLPESNDELDQVVSFLKTNPRVEILLGGHTDGRGNPDHNMKLSQKRVERVKDYLVSKGISSKRITGKGFGGTKPIAANDEEETRRLNRRVEFTIVKD